MDESRCNRCGGERYLFDRVVNAGLLLDYMVCDTCMTRELLQTGFRPDEQEDSPANVEAWELSRYAVVIEPPNQAFRREMGAAD